MKRNITIPKAESTPFIGGIHHPALYLWDAWSYSDDECIHLYCLAVNRQKDDGSLLLAQDRNGYQFHIRHFVSVDNGIQWWDKGEFQRAALAEDGHDARNIWSGSIMPLNDSLIMAAYTGVKEYGEEHPFVQTLAVGLSTDGASFIEKSGQLLLCPVRDEQQLREAGYYFVGGDDVGNVNGEGGGPILAWRDPFCFRDEHGQIYMAWAAKQSATQAALGLARLGVDDNGSCQVEELLAPVALPDDEEFTQMELPKIYFDNVAKRYLLLAATTTRETEGQSDEEVCKCIRLYVAESPTGPWHKSSSSTSEIAGLDCLFGMAAIKADFTEQKLLCMAPYTEAAGATEALGFANVLELDLAGIGGIDQLRVK